LCPLPLVLSLGTTGKRNTHLPFQHFQTSAARAGSRGHLGAAGFKASPGVKPSRVLALGGGVPRGDAGAGGVLLGAGGLLRRTTLGINGSSSRFALEVVGGDPG